jgi:hypothetical protein
MGQADKGQGSREAEFLADVGNVTREGVALGLRIAEGVRERQECDRPSGGNENPRVENLGDYLFELARLNLRFHEQMIELGRELADRIFDGPRCEPDHGEPDLRKIALTRTATGASGEKTIVVDEEPSLEKLTAKVRFRHVHPHDGPPPTIGEVTLTLTSTPHEGKIAVQIVATVTPPFAAGEWVGLLSLPQTRHLLLELRVAEAAAAG